MVKLLRADLTHMRKSKCFWACLIFSAVVSVLNLIEPDIGWKEHTAQLFLVGNSNPMLFTAIFAALFLGTGYSNGTLRNKMIIGSKRVDIYVSNLITVFIGSLLIMLAKHIPTAIAACFGKKFGMDADEFAFDMIIVICSMAAASAIFTLLGMLITSKSANTAITITTSFVLIIGAAIILSLLMQPEFVSGYVYSQSGDMTLSNNIPNPAYIAPGAKRDILTAVNDVLPAGQLMQMEKSGELHNQTLMPLYSLGVLTVTSAAGVLVFRRKDVK